VTFRIELTESAAKAFKAIPKTAQKRIAKKIESLPEPFIPAQNRADFLCQPESCSAISTDMSIADRNKINGCSLLSHKRLILKNL